MFQDKNILITGATGMIGRELVKLLKTYKPAMITSASLDDTVIEGVVCEKVDLTDFNLCKEVCANQNYIFHLAGIKGSPEMTKKNPASFFVPMLQFNTNMMEAARQANVDWYLYTSSVGVYAPADLFVEDDVWKTFPSQYDWFAGWAKRMGELQAEAYKIQYEWNKVSIVRPANIYGEYDNFNPKTSMVIPALIARICNGESPLSVWGNGMALRDFCHASDVAKAMVYVVEKGITEPVNIGSGEGVLIKDIVDAVVESYKEITDKEVSIEWDITKPVGDAVRKMDMGRLHSYGFKAEKSLKQGIKEAMLWYLTNKDEIQKRYDVFTK